MNVDPVAFRLFERESAGVLAPHVRAWALQALLAGLPYEARVAERNRALLAASQFLPEEMSTAERVRRLHAELSAVARSPLPSHPDESTMRGCLAMALLARKNVPNQRQLRNILDGL
ncbi:MAG TPA: hypothetical protein VK689_02855 [Armatimonadota bacterium]|nr:hypothetical protein [Armatimonadota bacterium]